MTTKESPTISLQMNDFDVVYTAALMMNATVYGPYYHKRQDRYDKAHYRLGVYGNEAIGWMMTILPFMGERRQTKIREIISAWKNKQCKVCGRKG